MTRRIIIGNYTYSSWSMRGWLAVDHSGLAHETVRLAMDTPEFAATIKAYSPTGQVPVLQDGDITVHDSLAIIDYLARTAPDHYWWPEDKAAYALARSVSSEMHSSFLTLRRSCPMNLRRSYKGLTYSDALMRDINRIEAIWTECRTRFGAQESKRPGPFLFGAFSAADMMFAPVVSRFITYGIASRTGASALVRAYITAVNSYRPIDLWYKAAQLEKERIATSELDQNITHIG